MVVSGLASHEAEEVVVSSFFSGIPETFNKPINTVARSKARGQ